MTESNHAHPDHTHTGLRNQEKGDLSRLCIHTRTTRTWTLEECIHHYKNAGIGGISVWRDVLESISPDKARELLEAHEMEVVSLVRGGFFPSVDAGARKKSIADNLEAIGQAKAIGAPLLVLVCGADPGQSSGVSVEQIREGIRQILPAAVESGVKLAIEPLHPMYAADRSAIVTLEQANSLAEDLASDHVGIALDVFHVWWDPQLRKEIMRCGKNGNLMAYHLCDWKPDMSDMLNDRGLMGEGCIDLRQIGQWMEEAGFTGYREVEIFSEKYWAMDQVRYLELIKSSYLNLI